MSLEWARDRLPFCAFCAFLWRPLCKCCGLTTFQGWNPDTAWRPIMRSLLITMLLVFSISCSRQADMRKDVSVDVPARQVNTQEVAAESAPAVVKEETRAQTFALT